MLWPLLLLGALPLYLIYHLKNQDKDNEVTLDKDSSQNENEQRDYDQAA